MEATRKNNKKDIKTIFNKKRIREATDIQTQHLYVVNIFDIISFKANSEEKGSKSKIDYRQEENRKRYKYSDEGQKWEDQ